MHLDRWHQARARRHLDVARLGRPGLGVQLGCLRTRVCRARWAARRERLDAVTLSATYVSRSSICCCGPSDQYALRRDSWSSLRKRTTTVPPSLLFSTLKPLFGVAHN